MTFRRITVKPFRPAAVLLIFALAAFSNPGLGGEARQPGNSAVGTRTVDVLPMVVPTRDRIEGNVVKTAGRLFIASRWFIGATRLPYLPSDEYDLELEVSRIAGNDGIGIVLPVVDHQEVTLVVGGYPDEGGLDGLNYVDGENLISNGTAIKSCIRNQETMRLMVQVRAEAITYRCDCGAATIGDSYPIRGRALSIDDRVDGVQQRSLALYQVKGESEFTKIVVRDYGGGRKLASLSD